MDVLYQFVVVTHLLGMAALIGGYLVVVTRNGGPLAPNAVMVWGARLQILTGLILTGLAEAVWEGEVNHTKIGVKLIIALAVAACTEIAAARARKNTTVTPGLVHAAGALAIVNVLVAVLWT